MQYTAIRSGSQAEVSVLLARAIVFANAWFMGLGSIYCLMLASKAHRIINQSGGHLHGIKRVWFCYLLGGFGAIFWFLVITAMAICKLQNG